VNYESRGWWTPVDESFDAYRGVDVEVCFPLGPVSGAYPFTLHIQLRDLKAPITDLRIQLANGRGNPTAFERVVNLVPDADGYGEWYLTDVVVDTSVTHQDGWQEFRFTANVRIDEFGLRQYQSTGLQAYVQNGFPELAPYRRNPWWETRGWYELTDYANDRHPFVPPTSPVSGVWTFPWICTATGSGTVTYHAAYVDANTHAIPMVLPHTYAEGTGAFNGIVSIDTTALSNGRHKLITRCDLTVSEGTTSAVTQILFRVDNGIAILDLATAAMTSPPVAGWVAAIALVILLTPRRPRRRSVRTGRAPPGCREKTSPASSVALVAPLGLAFDSVAAARAGSHPPRSAMNRPPWSFIRVAIPLVLALLPSLMAIVLAVTMASRSSERRGR
jgi:hypothetical protein